MKLVDKKCVPCDPPASLRKALRAGDPSIPKLSRQEAEKLNKEVEDWTLEEKNDHLQISKQFEFKNFKEALEFVNKVGAIAQEQDHHPNLYIIYNKVKVILFSHVISGLHENDFILAAKIDRLSL